MVTKKYHKLNKMRQIKDIILMITQVKEEVILFNYI